MYLKYANFVRVYINYSRLIGINLHVRATIPRRSAAIKLLNVLLMAPRATYVDAVLVGGVSGHVFNNSFSGERSR